LVIKLDLLLPHTLPVEVVLKDPLVNLGFRLHDTEVSAGVHFNEMLDLLILQVAPEDILGGLRPQPIRVAKGFGFVFLRVLFRMIDFLLEAGSAEARLYLDYFISEVVVEPIHVLALGSTRPKGNSSIGHILPRYGIGGN
jgi:hypothetical protein